MTDPIVHCSECIFFNRMPKGDTTIGYCQINAPIIFQANEHKTGQFPIVQEIWWCGEGQRKL